VFHHGLLCYDPQYGKLTGQLQALRRRPAITTATISPFKTSCQGRVSAGAASCGVGAATGRMTFTGPLINNRIVFTQSFENRFVRTPVNSLPLSGTRSFSCDVLFGHELCAIPERVLGPARANHISKVAASSRECHRLLFAGGPFRTKQPRVHNCVTVRPLPLSITVAFI